VSRTPRPSAKGPSGTWPLRLTHEGRYALLLSFLVAAAAANTGVNLLYLVLGALIAAVVLDTVAAIWAVLGLSAQVDLPERAMVGLDLDGVLGLSRRRGVGGVVVDLGPPLGGRHVLVEELARGTACEQAFSAVPTHRGRLRLESLAVASLSPLGLVATRRTLSVSAETLVLPRVRSMSAVAERVLGASGESRTAALGEGSDLRDLRPYVVGDSPRRIHWRASAKRDWPLVKELESEASKRVRVVLADAGGDEDRFELEVERVASLVASHLRRGDWVDLELGRLRLRSLAGAPGRRSALTALALVRREDLAAEPAAVAKAGP